MNVSAKDVTLLSIPLIIILLISGLFGFIERVLFTKYSLDAIQVSLTVVYLLRIFQVPCIAIARMSQVFVGTYNGSKEYHKIGPCVWQLIWFSFLSMIVVLPVSMLAASVFFKGTVIEAKVYTYFTLLSGMNFLYPLGSCLACFFLGREKTRLVVYATLASYTLNIILDFILIYGLHPLIPPMGLMGGALSTFLSQGLYCGLLFSVFLSKVNQRVFNTNRWHLNWRSFITYVGTGTPRALGSVILLTAWSTTAHIMTAKGGVHLLILSIGGSVILFLSCISDGICQALVSIVSNLVGARRYSLLKTCLKSGFVIFLVLASLLSLPLVFFPEKILCLISPRGIDIPTQKMLIVTMRWIWIHSCIYLANSVFLAFILAFKDTVFLFAMGVLSWITTYIPVYLAIKVWDAPAQNFWLVVALGLLPSSFIFLWRINQKAVCLSKQEMCVENP